MNIHSTNIIYILKTLSYITLHHYEFQFLICKSSYVYQVKRHTYFRGISEVFLSINVAKGVR